MIVIEEEIRSLMKIRDKGCVTVIVFVEVRVVDKVG